MIDVLNRMAHSPLHNYIVPGLTSWLIFDNGERGKLRMFTCDRVQQEFITPHSHRFAFQACVLKGHVTNQIWVEDEAGDEYQMTVTFYNDKPGMYRRDDEMKKVSRYGVRETFYKAGMWYGMEANEIHSIRFSRDSAVLFLEGPTISQKSAVLEPVVNGIHIPTMKTEPWMFIGGEA